VSPFARFVVRHVAFGMLVGALFVALLLLLNVGDLRGLIARSDAPLKFVLLLTLLISSTFASAQVGFAVMFGRRDER
jgi:hypothetical protein